MLSVVYFFIDIFVVNIEPIHGQNDIAGFQYTCRGCPLVSGTCIKRKTLRSTPHAYVQSIFFITLSAIKEHLLCVSTFTWQKGWS